MTPMSHLTVIAIVGREICEPRREEAKPDLAA